MEAYRNSIVLFCLLVYFAMCIGVGIWALRRTKSSQDFFMAGRELGIVVTSCRRPRRDKRAESKQFRGVGRRSEEPISRIVRETRGEPRSLRAVISPLGVQPASV